VFGGVWFGSDATHEIYENTQPKSPLRRLHVDMMLFRGGQKDINKQDPPKNFLIDSINRITSTHEFDFNRKDTVVLGMKRFGCPDFDDQDCRYHYHKLKVDEGRYQDYPLPEIYISRVSDNKPAGFDFHRN